MVNTKRMLDLFFEMVQVTSLSKNERVFCDFLKPILLELGGELYEDNAGVKTGGNCGNLFVTFPRDPLEGTGGCNTPLILNAHMDTVSPGVGIVPVMKGDNTVVSKGDTILGADDKAGIALIIEVLRALRDTGQSLRNIEALFTVSEEIGLVGAKHLEHERLNGKHCIAFDSGKTSALILRAPALNLLKFNVYGKEAHAGVCPELGINAIMVAAEAISNMTLGRIDKDTTANIGLIEGGRATNIVPNKVTITGEARSHDLNKLQKQTQEMRQCVKNAVEKYADKGGRVRFTEEINMDFPLLSTPEDGFLVSQILSASEDLGLKLSLDAAGGGSDANIFQSYGIESVIMGMGMEHPHTTNESLSVTNLETAAGLTLRLYQRAFKS